MQYLLMGIAIVIIILLLRGIVKYYKNQSSKTTKKKSLLPVKCPLCASSLFVGENLYSKVYRPMKVPDQLMIIMGCPHCYPKCEQGVSRICPVCHKKVNENESLTARLFNKSVGKKHVHVIGCSNCHKPRKD